MTTEKKYDVNDPTTYEIRYVLQHRTSKKFLCRGSFGWSWEEIPNAELFSYNQALSLQAGRMAGYGRVENSDIVDATTIKNFPF